MVRSDDPALNRDFEDIVLYATNIAYHEARKGGKRGTFDEHKFEAFEMTDLVRLRDSILDGTYRPSRGTAHIIHNPVIREIFAACFPDRVVHHLIYDVVYDWWDNHFIENSFSCREGKGTLAAVQTLARQVQSISNNYQKKVYVIKLDIQGYFMSLPRKQLYDRAIWGLDRQFEGNYGKEYEMIKFLWAQTIFDDPCKGVRKKGKLSDWDKLPPSKSLFCQPPGVGIVIGNLTSQLLSNIYLDQLDRFVTEKLGYKYYGRYVDDFYFLVTEDELPQALEDVKKIERYLKEELLLTLHPNKRYIQSVDRGVPYVGGIVYPDRIYPGKRLIRNAAVAFDEVMAGARDVDSVVSYLGHMKAFQSRKILKELFERNGWEYKF